MEMRLASHSMTAPIFQEYHSYFEKPFFDIPYLFRKSISIQEVENLTNSMAIHVNALPATTTFQNWGKRIPSPQKQYQSSRRGMMSSKSSKRSRKDSMRRQTQTAMKAEMIHLKPNKWIN